MIRLFSIITLAYFSIFLFSCSDGGGGSSNSDDSSTSSSSTSVASISTPSNCSLSSSTFTCTGDVSVSLSATNSSTIYFATGDGVAPTVNSLSDLTEFSSTVTVNESNTYVSYGTSVSDLETVIIKIQSLKAVQNTDTSTEVTSGYSDDDVQFQLLFNDTDRTTNSSQFNIYTLLNTDPSSDIGSVFSSGTTPNTSSDAYTLGNAITATAIADSTEIYEYAYNVHNTNSDSVDEEGTLVLYIDQDNPRVMALPPSSGTLGTSIAVDAFNFDEGFFKITEYAITNSGLTSPTAPTAQFCNPSSFTSVTKSDLEGNSTFWTTCTSAQSTFSTQTFTSDSVLGVQISDVVSNTHVCNPSSGTTTISACSTNNQDSSGNNVNDHIVEQYQIGRLSTGYYDESHEVNTDSTLDLFDFGYSISTGDLDGDGDQDDIAIGAPGVSRTLGLSAKVEEAGSIYIWYDEFRERALHTFTYGTSGEDVSSTYMDFSADGNGTIRVYLDPSSTATTSSTVFKAFSTEITTVTAATAEQVAAVLNRAFMASLKSGSNPNPLYAIGSSSAGTLIIGHRNKNIINYFTYSSNKGSGNLVSVTNAIRAFDVQIYGTTAGDQFGFASDIGKVDSNGTVNGKNSLIVGAPGYDSSRGAVYIFDAPTIYTNFTTAPYPTYSATNDSFVLYGETSSTGKLGHTISLGDRDADTFEEVYVSAPEIAAGGTKRGRVYEIPSQDFFASRNNSAADTLISAGRNYFSGTVDNALFGFSSVIGQTNFTISSNIEIYVGAPGEISGSVVGKVYYIKLNSSLVYADNSVDTLMFDISPTVYQTAGSLYGYSIEIISDTAFDTGSACPCLVVGAPGFSSNLGSVNLLGDNGLTVSNKYDGTSTNEMFGLSLLADTIQTNSTNQYLFIGSRNGNLGTGKVNYMGQQDISSTLSLNSNSVSGSVNGEVHGLALGVIKTTTDTNADKALIVGSPGGNTTASVGGSLNGLNFKTGSVTVYDNRLLDSTFDD